MRKYTELFNKMDHLEPGTRCFSHGGCQIFIAPPYKGDGYHMSISHKKRYPSWDEIRDAWYTLVPDAKNRTAVMYLPKETEYVNMCSTCFHVYEKK